MSKRGFFQIGIYHTKNGLNVGSLWRAAEAFGASGVFTVGRRYKRQASDTTKVWRRTPLLHHSDLEHLKLALPMECPLIGVELTDSALSLTTFQHPERACYLLGAEDYGLSQEVLEQCYNVVRIPGLLCLNVANAGAILMYDRIAKG